MPQHIYLSLGANIGDRLASLRSAVATLQDVISLGSISSVYETAPVGFENQPPFLNIAVEGVTDLLPHELLHSVKSIEKTLGRLPARRWGPRAIDIDILLYGNQVLETYQLTIPHREMLNRGFVLAPLAEIAPDLVHPVESETILALLKALPEDHEVVRVGGLYEG